MAAGLPCCLPQMNALWQDEKLAVGGFKVLTFESRRMPIQRVQLLAAEMPFKPNRKAHLQAAEKWAGSGHVADDGLGIACARIPTAAS